MKSDEKSSCCTPSSLREEAPLSASGAVDCIAAMAGQPPIHRPRASRLPGGSFLMGTDYTRGFPGDGEGPVRAVSLSPFVIDTFPVTNAEFAVFVDATNHRTEAEAFGWSFVFWSHIPPERFKELVEDTARTRRGGVRCRAPPGITRRAQGPMWISGRIIRSSMFPGTTHPLTPHGPRSL